MISTPRLKEAIKVALPKGKRFTIEWQPLEFTKAKVLRIVTPAWKTLEPWERIVKVQEILEQELTKKEQDQIFRVSVLTSNEYRRLKNLLPSTTRNQNGHRKCRV
jgi:hypothetical protein